MMGNESIDLGLKNIWKTWFEFKKGKRLTSELYDFQYHLEQNLYSLFKDLNNGAYHHGSYRKFVICDNKRREISVASVRDRLVHRLIYDYLNKIYDKTFIYDVWSCRLGKGLLATIERTQTFLQCYPRSYIWKVDVKKFFDSVDQEILLKILSFKIRDDITFSLLKEVIDSFSAIFAKRVGIPIGNLTSQIFANIYLNELDRFMKHELSPKAYLRYGDDFILIEGDLEKLKIFRIKTTDFLEGELKLQINPKSDKIFKVPHGLKFLGLKLWSYNRTLNRRNLSRTRKKLKMDNISSYSGLLMKNGSSKQMKYFNWLVSAKLLDENDDH